MNNNNKPKEMQNNQQKYNAGATSNTPCSHALLFGDDEVLGTVDLPAFLSALDR